VNRHELAQVLPTAWEEFDAEAGQKMSTHYLTQERVWKMVRNPQNVSRRLEAIWNGYERIGWWNVSPRSSGLVLMFRQFASSRGFWDIPVLNAAKNGIMLFATPLQWITAYPRYEFDDASRAQLTGTLLEDNNQGGWITTKVTWKRRDDLFVDPPNYLDVAIALGGMTRKGLKGMKRS